jgi:hypothetical protein
MQTHADKEQYERSIRDPAGFWADYASQFHWDKKVGVTDHSLIQP